jgi:hypothetical protein
MFIENNSQSIAEKITTYINNPKLKILHGKEGRDFVRTNFEETMIWDQIHKQLGY